MWSSVAWAGRSFMPVAGSEVAEKLDSLYSFLLISSAISCVLLIGGMIYFAVKYRRKSANDKTAYITHNHFLEFLWSFIPFVLFMVVFAWGWWIYDESRDFPEDAFEVHVVGKQWAWEYLYKSGRQSVDLVVPQNRPVKLIMTSQDVLHSFFIPSMRVKQDVLPGRYTAIWFESKLAGEFNVFCTEYCGTKHSNMISMMKVLPEAEFEEWLANDPTKGMSLAEQGQNLLKLKGCVACHSSDGSRVIGPTFKGLWNAKREFADGSNALADANYIRESILNPNAKIVKTYPAGAMPTFQGQIKEAEITAIIEYFKSLK